MSGDKPKIAILGGGVGAVTAAYWLSQPGWRDRFESITVYQMGFRLGGKGASGRNMTPGYGHRIEEHGLHIWLGYYQNAFRMLDAAYTELHRDESCPIRCIDEAFEPSSAIVAQDPGGGSGWTNWYVEFDYDLKERPWDPDVPDPPLTELIGRALRLARVYMESASGAQGAHAAPPIRLEPANPAPATSVRIGPATDPITTRLTTALADAAARIVQDAQTGIDVALGAALELCEALIEREDDHGDEHDHATLVSLVDRAVSSARTWLRARVLPHDDARRAYQLADVLLACVRGLLASGALLSKEGLDALDDKDFAEFLLEHGAHEDTVYCPPLRAVLWDMAFSYEDGEPERPRGSASESIRGLFRVFLTYRGAIAWKMRAGMGDVVFAPLYEVLRNRGVAFEFFHRTDRLRLSDDKTRIDSIEMTRQAAPAGKTYEPLIDVKGLPCWPAAPLAEQLEGSPSLTAHDVESFWSAQHVDHVTLRDGDEFDIVVLGISLGALPYICEDLVAASDSWKDMTTRVKTVNTQAFQIWLDRDLSDLGLPWRAAASAGYVEPFDSAADMRQTLPAEAWGPQGVMYFCNTLPTPRAALDPDDHGYPSRMHEVVKQNAIGFLRHHAWVHIPRATVGYPDDFRWEHLVDPQDREGVERFDSQYWRANVEPSERYVQAMPGTLRYRLEPGDSGFKNLVLAGDWTRGPLSVGCVEAAVTSGMLAAQAISGVPDDSKIAGRRMHV